MPRGDAALVAKLKAAGAIVLGKTNVTELGGLFDANMPEGYSSLGGQVLLPSDTDKTPAGSSAGSAAATAAGLAALTVGLETSTDTAQMIAPAGVAGVVGFKPTVGRGQPRRRARRRPVAGLARPDRAHGAPTRRARTRALSGTQRTRCPRRALSGKRVAVISSTTAPYPAAVTAVTGARRDDGDQDRRHAVAEPAEHRHARRSSATSTRTSAACPAAPARCRGSSTTTPRTRSRGSSTSSASCVAALSPGPVGATTADLAAGKASNAAVIDALLADTDVIMVPSGNALVGIADRAGYPVLTVPAGYGTGGAGRNPIGVTFVGTAGSEAALLAAGYAFEQATNVRLAPSFTNPSMFRCVAGSTFFSPHHCHPGDLQSADRVRADRDAGGRRRRRHRAGDARR